MADKKKIMVALLYSKVTPKRSKDPEMIDRDSNNFVVSIRKVLKKRGYATKDFMVNLDVFEELRKEKKNIDIVFNLCDDGFFDNSQLEPHVASMLDVLELRYTGSNYRALALRLDKEMANRILSTYGIPTPKFQVFSSGNEPIDKRLKFPLIVKPVHEDASIGISNDSVVDSEKKLRERIKFVIKKYNQPALVEMYIEGREINVAILGNDNLEVLPPSEIIFDKMPKGLYHILSYKAKWKIRSEAYKKTPPKCPAEIEPKLKEKIIKIATAAYKIVGARGYGRVDFRVDKNNKPYVLEVNLNPDLSEDAGMTNNARAAGYSYDQLIEKILKYGLG